MNNNTAEAFSIICENEDIFEFTQLYGLHGVAIQNTEEPDESWFNPKLAHSLGYNDARALTWKKIISPKDLEEIEEILAAHNHSGDILVGEITFLHSKGFFIPMTYKSLCVGENVIIALKKISDYSNIEFKPEQDFKREQLLDTVLDTINIGIIACDSKGKLTLFNKAAKKWHGLPAKDIPQAEYASYYNLYEPDGKTLFKIEDIPLINMLQEGEIRKPEMIIKARTGRKRIVNITGARLYDERKNISGAVIAMHDITEKKEAEEKLRISEETFRGSFESAADGMAITDASGICIEVNDRLCEIMGYPANELKSLNFQEVTYPEDLEEDLKLWNQLLDGEIDHYQMEKRAIHKSGKIKHIIVSVAIVRDENNQPFHFITQITDISSLKEAEKELHNTLNQLENLLESSTRVSIIALDQQGSILMFNKGAENLLGYTRTEMIGQKTLLDLHFKDEIQIRANELSEAHGRKVEPEEVFHIMANRGKPDTKEWNYRCKNGEALPIQLTVTPIYDNESLTGYLCVATDISELKRAQSKIRSILEITEEQNDRLRNFAHIVSHNLRSHSGNIQMLMEIYLEENPELKENEVIKMLLTASENLTESIEHLNEVALINTSVLNKLPSLNLKKSVMKSLTSINALIQKSNLKVINNIPEKYEVLSLPAYLDSIILNFTTNAVKYRSPERKPVLKFNAIKKNDYITLEIEDNGIGIDLEKDGSKLFGMYKTFHGNEDARGIGLFITKNQIEAIGGKIEVKSVVDRGTVFTISFKYEKI
ncbi:PAS domain S-box protein [Salegentibacter sp. JZCK2]|uniref:PAS domain-containing sensor histidine kinase n=1 Tax=Salegentibacter tibetensis TaxID=2873600 RepID=UPI001CCD3456|nr:PAS domain-containing sensor histidine kinase [Salegentibacter tibetensis]MBZ9731372.1 PAS domain S-box protein [Salegentibacter tibetensis]